MSESTPKREGRSVVTGTVTSAKMKDTIVVRQGRMVKHGLYGKYIRRHSKYYAHDAGNTARVGDEVEIEQTRPLSKLKNWRLVRIVRKGDGGVQHADIDASVEAATGRTKDSGRPSGKE
ncbi:MAG: hypothetical protein HMLKMBBP_00944 [Planctomycetes bacterium]|nr:hypothetical protein [Planctomycetota bacterium]